MQRKALRYDKGADQHYDYISAWIKATRGVGSRRLAVLPGGDAGGRRGPALHRPADGGPGLGGHRQRRPARARRGRGRRPRRRARRHARVPVQPGPGRHLPVAGPQVRRGQAGDRRRHGPRARARRGAAARPPALAAYPAAAKLGRGQGYDSPHAHPGHVSGQTVIAARAGGRALLPARRGRGRFGEAAGGAAQGPGRLGERRDRRRAAGVVQPGDRAAPGRRGADRARRRAAGGDEVARCSRSGRSCSRATGRAIWSARPRRSWTTSTASAT